jgi:hypothetical protein
VKSYKQVRHKGMVVREHRILAEKVLGRPLPEGVEIHHLEGGHTGPIVICQDSNYHKLLEVRTRAFLATGDPHKRQCRHCHEWDSVENLYKHPNQHMFEHYVCKQEYEKKYRKARYMAKYGVETKALAKIVEAGGNPDTDRVCSICGQAKNKSEFYLRHGTPWLSAYCKSCHNTRRKRTCDKL